MLTLFVCNLNVGLLLLSEFTICDGKIVDMKQILLTE